MCFDKGVEYKVEQLWQTYMVKQVNWYQGVRSLRENPSDIHLEWLYVEWSYDLLWYVTLSMDMDSMSRHGPVLGKSKIIIF